MTVEQVATDFGVHPMTLWKWMRPAGPASGSRAVCRASAPGT
ncbi:hypothetical protein [Streptomyces sp. GESEQ-13]